MQVVASSQVAALHKAQHPRAIEAAPCGALAQLQVARQVQAVEPGRLVDVLQADKPRGAGQIGRATLAKVAALGIHKVLHPGDVAGGLEPPLSWVSVMPVATGTECVRHFRFEVDIANVGIAVTDKVVHQRGHGLG